MSEQVLSSAAVEHLRWAMIPGIGPVRFGRIVERFGSPGAALQAGAGALAEVDGIGPALAQQIVASRGSADLEAEVALAARHKVTILCAADEAYPAALRQIPDPPICLYTRGRLEPADAVALAIVGSRRCTTYGREQAYRFGYQLAGSGLTIVSGLARGIDGESHKGALAAGGRTVAVLGNGLASIYPPEHRELAERICEHGAILSELPMSTGPEASNFLPRNRIIAGLALGVLVVEAARRSGSLTTARLAAEYNREVFAVPGKVDSELSAGTNGLIRDQHGKLVTCAADVLDELGGVGEALSGAVSGDAKSASGAGGPNLSDDENRIWQSLDGQERSIEQLAASTGLSAAKVAGVLVRLQLKGLARQLPGNLFVRARTP